MSNEVNILMQSESYPKFKIHEMYSFYDYCLHQICWFNEELKYFSWLTTLFLSQMCSFLLKYGLESIFFLSSFYQLCLFKLCHEINNFYHKHLCFSRVCFFKIRSEIRLASIGLWPLFLSQVYFFQISPEIHHLYDHQPSL